MWSELGLDAEPGCYRRSPRSFTHRERAAGVMSGDEIRVNRGRGVFGNRVKINPGAIPASVMATVLVSVLLAQCIVSSNDSRVKTNTNFETRSSAPEGLASAMPVNSSDSEIGHVREACVLSLDPSWFGEGRHERTLNSIESIALEMTDSEILSQAQNDAELQGMEWESLVEAAAALPFFNSKSMPATSSGKDSSGNSLKLMLDEDFLLS